MLCAHLIDNRYTKRANTCGIEGGTILTSFENIVNMKTPNAVTNKAQQFLQIPVHLTMAEMCSEVTKFRMI
jgi:hypothetical protein